MKKIKDGAFYVGLVGAFSILMYWVVIRGEDLEKGRNIIQLQSGKSQWQEFLEAMQHN